MLVIASGLTFMALIRNIVLMTVLWLNRPDAQPLLFLYLFYFISIISTL